MEPRVRARHMKSLVLAIDRLPRTDQEAVSARISLATRKVIEDATGVDWLLGGLNLEVTRAIYAGLGPEGGRRFFRETLRVAFSGPLLRIIVDAAQRVFRLDPASFAGWLGTGWILVFRHCGHWAVERAGATEAAIRIVDLPPEFAGDAVWLDSVAHSLEAFFEVTGAKGSVEIEERDRATGRALFRLRWE